jgi:hypothetical protein
VPWRVVVASEHAVGVTVGFFEGGLRSSALVRCRRGACVGLAVGLLWANGLASMLVDEWSCARED